MSGHTPGPWVHYSASKHYPPGSSLNYGSIIWATGVGEVAQTPGLSDVEKDNANARLIAAAPELLEALQALQDGWVANHIPAATWAKARAAITKATGESNV